MDIEKFKYIVAVAQERSFTKAAKKMYISQPALSQYVGAIEEEFKVKLFDRSKNPLVTTYAGEVFLKKAMGMIQLENELWKEFEDIAENKVGNITIGVSQNRSPYILPLFFQELRRRYPNIKIDIFERSGKQLEKSLLNGEIDIAILGLPITLAGIEYEKVFDEEIWLIGRSELDMTKFQEYDFILLRKGQRLRNILENFFRENHIVPNILLESDSQECILALVEQGAGVGFVSDMILRSKRWKDSFKTYSLGKKPLTRNFAVAYVKDKKLNNVEKTLIEILKTSS